MLGFLSDSENQFLALPSSQVSKLSQVPQQQGFDCTQPVTQLVQSTHPLKDKLNAWDNLAQERGTANASTSKDLGHFGQLGQPQAENTAILPAFNPTEKALIDKLETIGGIETEKLEKYLQAKDHSNHAIQAARAKLITHGVIMNDIPYSKKYTRLIGYQQQILNGNSKTT